MTDSLDGLAASLIGRYTIEQELGSGGMATVYLAEDVKHHRKVAVKVLRPELAAALGAERFLHEIEIAAQLNHPHILALHDSGEVNGYLFYVMPVVEGESLRARLDRQHQLPIDEAVSLTQQIASALDYAHRRGVIHRDIKPENVLLHEGEAMLTDFGIALAVTEAGGTRLTETGFSLGTPDYMSPEQAAGERELDARSDVYALGCVLFEMLAGEPPFTGNTAQSVIAKRLTESPPSVSTLRDTVSDGLSASLTKALARSPVDRYESASMFASALADTTNTTTAAASRWSHPVAAAALFSIASLLILGAVYAVVLQLGLPDWVLRATVGLLIIGLPIIVTTAISEKRRMARSDRSRFRWLSWRQALNGVGLAFTGLAVVTAGFMAMRALGIGPLGTLLATGALERGGKIILADFENRTDDPTLGPSVTAALRVDLSQSRVITLIEASVIAEALRRMERAQPAQLDAEAAREVAEREDAKAVITGEISRLGGGYLLLANLVSPTTGDVLAAVRKTAADEEEIIAALDQLSADLRNRIGEPLRAIRAGPRLDQVTTPSLEALRKYSQAMSLRNAGDERGALVLLEEAVAIDTAFAMAYRAMGSVVRNLGLSPTRNVAVRRKAFQHRDRLPELERFSTMGSYYTGVTSELDKARDTYEAAVDAYPNHLGAWHNLGLVHQMQRQDERAETSYLRAYELGYAPSLGNVVHVQVALGRFNDAQSTLELLASRLPGTAFHYRQAATLAYAQGDYERAINHLQDLARLPGPLGRGRALAHIHAVRAVEGKLAEAERYRKEATDRLAEARAGQDFIVVTVSGAIIRMMLGQDIDGATHDVDEALQQFPLDSLDPLDRPYLDIAMFYALADLAEQAKELLGEWGKLVETDLQRGAEPRRRLVQGVIALSENRATDAVQELRHALDAEPALLVQVVLPLLGRAYEAGGQIDSAIATYEQYLRSSKVRFGPTATSMMASAHNPDAAWRAGTYVRLGTLYERRGNKSLAVDYYGRFIDLWKDADSGLQPQVADVQRRIANLMGESSVTRPIN